MTPDQIDRLSDAVILASPMLGIGALMLVCALLWPVRGK